jgi:hypothetical protein
MGWVGKATPPQRYCRKWRSTDFIFLVRTTIRWVWVRSESRIILKKKNRVLGPNTFAVALCALQIVDELKGDWTWASAVRGRRLNAWTTAKSTNGIFRLELLWALSSHLRANSSRQKICLIFLRGNINIYIVMVQQPLVGQGLLIIDASRSSADTPHSVGFQRTRDQRHAETSTCKHTTHKRQTSMLRWD